MNNDLFFFLLFGGYALGLGACIASFLNVCIWRLPRNESVVRPASHCPNCNAPIRWYQNIPILSYLFLRGRCAACHRPISVRYVLVETLGGILFLMAYLQWAMPYLLHRSPCLGMVGVTDPGLIAVSWLVVAGLMLGSFIDLDHFYLPDRVTLGGMALGLPLSYLVPELHGTTDGLAALLHAALGLFLGFGLLWGVGFVFSKIFHKDAMGFGDVKLLGAIGAFFGPVAVLVTLVISSLVGSIVGLVLIARGRARLGSYTAVPYGPFLSLGALVWMYWGPALVAGYLALYAPV